MPVPSNPIDRRQVLKALAAIPVIVSPLGVPRRADRSASSTAAPTPAGTDAGHQPPSRGHHHLIGVL
jgi:hypothetical protein